MNKRETNSQEIDFKSVEPKHKEFVHQLILHKYNQTKAYADVYPDNKTPEINASQLLCNAKVQSYLKHMQKKEAERLGISLERMTDEFANLAFSDITDVMTEDYEVKPPSEIRNIKAVQSIKKTTTYTKRGDTKVQIEVKMHPKYQALEALAKHIGYFEVDNKQKAPITAIQVNINEGSEKPVVKE